MACTHDFVICDIILTTYIDSPGRVFNLLTTLSLINLLKLLMSDTEPHNACDVREVKIERERFNAVLYRL